MLNYHIVPELFWPFLLQGTELDSWQDQVFNSTVGFMFLNTRVLGASIPGHIGVEELNAQ
ncbi:MAG: DUF2071 domain-containing protein [Myxococcales bacterium]|nr:MAG: DUF2071 domain-containing protein [Myxococcales bacterium]